MSFIRKLEEGAAKKLRRIFLDSNKRAEYAVNDVERLEKELANAKVKAYNEAKAAHEAAVRAAEKAQKVAAELMLEVRACEERLKTQEEILKGNE
jgi:hypothetical protein